MRIKYFPDTDTALMESSGLKVAETKEINENIPSTSLGTVSLSNRYVDLDGDGYRISSNTWLGLSGACCLLN